MAIKNEKSYTMVLFTILLVLILFEKSARNTTVLSGNKQSLKNFAESIPEKKELLPTTPDNNLPLPPESIDIPEIEDPELELLEDTTEQQENHSIYLYYLKFYGKGNKAHSRLLKTERSVKPGIPLSVELVMDQLIRGPDANEKSQGVLNALPPHLTYSRNYRIENGILHLSLGPEIEFGAGPELMRDRIDQLTYTLLEIKEVKGIKLYIDGKKITSLGGDGIPVPNVLTKNNRIVMPF